MFFINKNHRSEVSTRSFDYTKIPALAFRRRAFSFRHWSLFDAEGSSVGTQWKIRTYPNFIEQEPEESKLKCECQIFHDSRKFF